MIGSIAPSTGDPCESFIGCRGRIERQHESFHPRSFRLVSMTSDDVMVGLEVMRHHLDEHRLPRSRLHMDGSAINASHRRHDAIFSPPIIEVIQAGRRRWAQRPRRYIGRAEAENHV